MNTTFLNFIEQQVDLIHPVVDFNPAREKIKYLDLSGQNSNLTAAIVSNTQLFTDFINKKRLDSQAKYLFGGYDELRSVYARSSLFDSQFASDKVRTPEEPRRLHLGIDIWGLEATPVYTPLAAVVHSFAFNKSFGDYGVTIILEHKFDRITFYTLYGHLSLRDIQNLEEGQYITKGEQIGHFGPEAENGYWPPHLHFQVILNIENYRGDYPGVCRYSERESFLTNCPDPDLILKLQQYAEI